MKIVSNKKFCMKVLSMILKSLKKYEDGVVIDLDGYKFSVFAKKGENSEGHCVFDIDWNELYRECHLKGRLSAYKTGKASVDVLWQDIRKMM
jgi:hypothetical protein